MITRFKPTRWFVTLAASILVLALGGFTLRTAEKSPTSQSAENLPADFALKKPSEAGERGIKILEAELAGQQARIEQQQNKVAQLKAKLGVSDLVEAGVARSGSEPEVWRQLQAMRIEAQAEVARSETMYRHLTNVTRVELRQIAPTACPDQLLTALLEQYSVTEQKLADLGEMYGKEHPEVKRCAKVLQKINLQIEERLDGILQGLKVKMEAEKARLAELSKQVEKSREQDIQSAIERRPFWDAKRELESLQQIRERLQLRLIQEKVDAAIPQSR